MGDNGRPWDGEVLMAHSAHEQDGHGHVGQHPHGTHSHDSVDEHAALVRSMLRFPRASESVALLDALDRVAAETVLSPVDLPLFRNSQMDGFAVFAHEIPGTLPIVATIAAREGSPAPLEPGTAVRIMTGAPVPQGATAIVPVEDTVVTNDTVTVASGRAVGEYIREAGSDVRTGHPLVHSGQRLAPRHLAVLAAAGIAEVSVRARITVAVITTGAELVSPGSPIHPGQIFDANSVALVALVRAAGATVSFVRRVPDEGARLLAVLGEASSHADLILTSGGISKGDFEVVRELLEPRGATVKHLAMQPGGPQVTAEFNGVPTICFPGNPVSTQLSFEVFVAPVLRELAGLPKAARTHKQLNEAVSSPPGKRQFLRGRIEGASVTPVSGSGSHLIAGLAASDCLIVIPEEVTQLALGESVEVLEL
jgi:molybdopterin molybdotransferase